MPVVLSVYSDYSSLVLASRSKDESFKAFESCFDATSSKFKCHGADITVPEPLLGLLLLNGPTVNDTQRVLNHDALVTTMLFLISQQEPSSTDPPTASSSDESQQFFTAYDYLKRIEYSTVTAALRKSERSGTKSTETANILTSLTKQKKKISKSLQKLKNP